MISFLTEEIRQAFHEIPIDRQREIQDFAKRKRITILFLDFTDNILEVSIRVDEQFDVP